MGNLSNFAILAVIILLVIAVALTYAQKRESFWVETPQPWNPEDGRVLVGPGDRDLNMWQDSPFSTLTNYIFYRK